MLSTRIGMNNQLRKALRVALAQFDLASPDPPCAWRAVTEMLRAVDADTHRAAAQARLAHESRFRRSSA